VRTITAICEQKTANDRRKLPWRLPEQMSVWFGLSNLFILTKPKQAYAMQASREALPSLGGRTDPVLRRVQRRAQRAGQQRKSYCARHRYPALYRFTYSSSSSSLLCVRVCVPFFLDVFLRKVLRKNCSLAELFSERNDLYLLSLVFFSFSASSSSTR
jgi:hypothetical protein